MLAETHFHQIKLFLSWLFPGFRSSAYVPILHTIKRNRILLVLIAFANLFSATVEGSTFGIIFFALSILGNEQIIETIEIPFLERILPLTFLQQLSQSQLFIGLVILAVVFQFLRNILAYIGFVAADYLSARIQVQVTESIFSQVLSFSFPCASRYKIGDLASYIDDTNNAIRYQIRYFNDLAISILMATSYVLVLIYISPSLIAITLVLCLGFLLVQRNLIPRVKNTSHSAIQTKVLISEYVVESFQALRVIHTFRRQQETLNQLRGLQQHLVPQLEQQSRWSRLADPLTRMLSISTIATLLIVGFLSLKDASTVLPSLLTFIIVLERLATKFGEISHASSYIAQNSGAMLRLQEILSPQGKQFTHYGGQQFRGLKRSIQFKQVSLQYPNTQEPALTKLDFELKKGQVTALVGASGAGKSSIADLLVGLYEPTSGSILVDGIELNQYDLQSWGQYLGVVSQDTFIFNQTLLENIRYGFPMATRETVIAAAVAAQADEFIRRLPDGYETVVGERGYRLSGGQRQRIALARAILKQPEILILDEATSALDTLSERLVQEALAIFQQDRTVLVIAHRLSTVTSADQILVLDQGCLIERGKHQDLLAQGNQYARYWQLQSKAIKA